MAAGAKPRSKRVSRSSVDRSKDHSDYDRKSLQERVAKLVAGLRFIRCRGMPNGSEEARIASTNALNATGLQVLTDIVVLLRKRVGWRGFGSSRALVPRLSPDLGECVVSKYWTV